MFSTVENSTIFYFFILSKMEFLGVTGAERGEINRGHLDMHVQKSNQTDAALFLQHTTCCIVDHSERVDGTLFTEKLDSSLF
jgi:hypothetical protein